MRLHPRSYLSTGILQVFFWFAGLSFLLVAWIFASPAIDYRLVIGAQCCQWWRWLPVGRGFCTRCLHR